MPPGKSWKSPLPTHFGHLGSELLRGYGGHLIWWSQCTPLRSSLLTHIPTKPNSPEINQFPPTPVPHTDVSLFSGSPNVMPLLVGTEHICLCRTCLSMHVCKVPKDRACTKAWFMIQFKEKNLGRMKTDAWLKVNWKIFSYLRNEKQDHWLWKVVMGLRIEVQAAGMGDKTLWGQWALFPAVWEFVLSSQGQWERQKLKKPC